jgi:hypothetical protein
MDPMIKTADPSEPKDTSNAEPEHLNHVPPTDASKTKTSSGPSS